MGNFYGRKVDSTYLDPDKAAQRGVVHRDMLAHGFRWTHVLRYLKPTHPSRIFDAACGRIAPLAKTLYSNRQTMHKYLGVDIGPIAPDVKYGDAFHPVFWQYVDVCDTKDDAIREALGGDPTLVTCFEAVEHVLPHHGVKLLRRLFDITSPDGELFLSTPCYDPKVGVAKNHVNEWTYRGLGTTLEMVGFTVKAHYGTFASQRDLLPFLSYEESDIFHRLEKYYDTNMLSVMFAPLYPMFSRNVLWHLTTKVDFAKDEDVPWRIDLFKAWEARQLGSSTDEAAWIEYGKAFGFC